MSVKDVVAMNFCFFFEEVDEIFYWFQRMFLRKCSYLVFIGLNPYTLEPFCCLFLLSRVTWCMFKLLRFYEVFNVRYKNRAMRTHSVKMSPKSSRVTTAGLLLFKCPEQSFNQGRYEMLWRLGHEAILAPLCSHRTWGLSEANVCCIEESTCNIVGTFPNHQQPFGAPRSVSARP